MMMPDATMVKITMKSILAARVSNSQHNPSHSSRMHAKRIQFPVVIRVYIITFNLQIYCKITLSVKN